MYDPTLVKIEILRLEKRLDDELLYLRDALPEYSTFDANMEQEVLPEGINIRVHEKYMNKYLSTQRYLKLFMSTFLAIYRY